MTTRSDAKLKAIDELRLLYPRGSTLYLITRSISRTGNSRLISPLCMAVSTTMQEVGGVRLPLHRITTLWPTHKVALALDMRQKHAGTHSGVISTGIGFNHAEALRSNLSYALYGDEQSLYYEEL